ncbi:MAG: sugar phosphate isomerase/epimerase [Chloroflexota bacterium]|nr:sugar phosphate isomerase/epimerase [Chloroflexota bacterium]
MKIGFATLVGIEPIPFPDLVKRAGALGLEAVEINAGPGFRPIGGAKYGGHIDLRAVANGGAGQVLDLLAEQDMTVTAIAPMLNLLTPDLARREERITSLKQAIDACVALESDVVVTYGGSTAGMHFLGLPAVGSGHPSNKLTENVQAFKEVYAPLARYAEDRGVRIAFETAPRGGGEGNLAHAPALWDIIFSEVPSPALGLSFDPGHLVWLQVPDIPGVIRAYGDRIYHMDGKDAEVLPAALAKQGITGNAWWRYRLPGQGQANWPAILSALREVGYQGGLSIENEDPMCLGLEGAAWAANYLRRCLLPAPSVGVGKLL